MSTPPKDGRQGQKKFCPCQPIKPRRGEARGVEGGRQGEGGQRRLCGGQSTREPRRKAEQQTTQKKEKNDKKGKGKQRLPHKKKRSKRPRKKPPRVCTQGNLLAAFCIQLMFNKNSIVFVINRETEHLAYFS